MNAPTMAELSGRRPRARRSGSGGAAIMRSTPDSPPADRVPSASMPVSEPVATGTRAARGEKAGELDSLLSALVSEVPTPAGKPTRLESAPAVSPPSPPEPVRRASLSLPWGRIVFGVASTAALGLLAFAPAVRSSIGSHSPLPDGISAPAGSNNFDAWRASLPAGEDFM